MPYGVHRAPEADDTDRLVDDTIEAPDPRQGMCSGLIYAEGWCTVVEPGFINAASRPQEHHWVWYIRRSGSPPISTIAAENAGGPGCIKYDVTYHHVQGLDVVLTDGQQVMFSENSRHRSASRPWHATDMVTQQF